MTPPCASCSLRNRASPSGRQRRSARRSTFQTAETTESGGVRIAYRAEATAHHLDPFSGRVTAHTLWTDFVGAFRLLHRV